MRLPRMRTRLLLMTAAFIGLALALVIQERRASRLEAELTATQNQLQYFHRFSRHLAFDLLRSEEALKTMATSKGSSP